MPDVFGALAFRAGFEISVVVPIFSFGAVFSYRNFIERY
jgi:hypothetical protein